MLQHGSLQIKTVLFEIAEHLFDPHPAAIVAQGQGCVWQIGGQAQGLLFTDLPVDQCGDRIDLLLGEEGLGAPSAFTSTLHETIRSLVTWTESHQKEIAAARTSYDRRIAAEQAEAERSAAERDAIAHEVLMAQRR